MTAQGRQFVGTCLAGQESFLVVLSTPGRQSSANPDLAFQDASGAASNGLCTLPAGFLGNEGELFSIIRDVAQQAHDTNHGIVVKGDMGGITLWFGKPLWPATVLVLAFEQVSDTSQGRIPKSLVFCFSVGISKQADFPVRCPIIDHCVIFVSVGKDRCSLLLREFFFAVVVLGPAATAALIQQDGFCDLQIFGVGWSCFRNLER